ncbi:hypothetical protein AVEN_194443-1 [Araneus ventricosus]|uniref:Endonuclease/exonuclease/phosphatase domain-containing protein n=1 Tax=Araneus ventricosus TaxID=182803 RepID=A0A4Y2A767_ARAVE|nr:hypothetical protein AVEN_194443-1 [Araneus ventricosus]
MSTFVSWNCRGIRSKLQDIKEMLNYFQLVFIGLQETFFTSNIPLKLRDYNSVRKDAATGANHSGGVCMLSSNLYPSTSLNLNTSLQAVAVQVHARTLVAVWSLQILVGDRLNCLFLITVSACSIITRKLTSMNPHAHFTVSILPSVLLH